jgi:GATA-binding protein
MVTPPNGFNPHRRVSQMASSERSHSPVSRTGTPGGPHDPNIAPQHFFENAGANEGQYNGSPRLPGTHSSPSAHLDGQVSYDQLVAANTNLRTRVSELEVINMVYSDNENNLRKERDMAVQERDELRRKVDELERHIQGLDAEHISKKPRLSNEPQE